MATLTDTPTRPASLILSATEIVGGDLIVTRGEVTGPEVARFPRTNEGHAAASAFIARSAAVTRFTAMRLQAEAILRTAAMLPGLPDLLVKQAEAAAKIAGNRFHRVHGQATGEDAIELRANLETIWEAVDPLILAVGTEAYSNFGTDRELFEDQLRGALEGNATHVLERAADRLGEDMPSIDPHRDHRTHQGRK